MNIKDNISFHNKFEFKLIDSVTGELKQEARAENVVLDQIWSALFSDKNYLLYGIELGTGSGTPSASDTSLFNRVFGTGYYGSPTVPRSRVETVHAYPTARQTLSFTFGASSSFVGNLTEVGMNMRDPSTAYGPLVSHAMIVDAEGQPITIEKTALDILIVTATFYVTISNSISGFNLQHAELNPFFNLLKRVESSSVPQSVGTSYANATLTQYYCDDFYASSQSADFSITPQRDASTKSITHSTTRVGTDSYNFGYFNALGLNNHGFFKLPNASIFAPYTMQGISVGTGDGSTQDFNCPLDMFIADTDTVYKNGVALTRGVDYTIDNIQNFNRRPEIAAWNFSECADAVESYVGSYYHGVPLTVGIYPSWNEPNASGNLALKGYSFTSLSNIVCRLKTPDVVIGRRINTLRFSNFEFQSYRYNNYPFTLKLESSSNGEEWSDFLSVDIEASDYTSISYGYTLTKEITFDTTELEYIRLSLIGSFSGNIPTLNRISLLRVGDPIHFTVAPEDGDIITMSAQIDRPFKNSNFVIDASSSISYL